MASEEHWAETSAIVAERCPICGTLMTEEQAGPIRFPAARHQMILPDAQIGEGQIVTRMRCENGHTFWAIEDDPEEQ
jgi:hypothetical protein